MNCFNSTKNNEYSYNELSTNSRYSYKSRIGCILKSNFALSILNLIILIIFIVILVFKIVPYASKIGNLNFDDISDTIDHIHSLIHNPDVKKVTDLIDELDVDSLKSYANKFQKIIDWGCAELPVNCSSSL